MEMDASFVAVIVNKPRRECLESTHEDAIYGDNVDIVKVPMPIISLV